MQMKKFFQNNFYLVMSVIAFIAIFTILQKAQLTSGDDIWFQTEAKKYGIAHVGEYLTFRYFNWSGRLPAEFFCVMLLLLPIQIWRFLLTVTIITNTFIITNLIKTMLPGKLSNQNEKILHVLLYGIIILMWFSADITCSGNSFFIKDLDCAVVNSGILWYSGSIYYFFPASILLWCIYFCKVLIAKKKIRTIDWTAIPIFAILVPQVEQTLIAFVFMFLAILIYFMKHKYYKHNRKLFIYFTFFGIFSALMCSLYLFSPGNANRTIIETSLRFPYFGTLDLFEKAGLAFAFGVQSFISSGLSIILIILLLCFLILLKKEHKISVSTIINFVFLLSYKIYLLFSGIKIALVYFNGDHLVYQVKTTFILFICIVQVFWIIWRLCGDEQERFFSAYFLVTIFTLYFLIGFSPTVFASGTRTSFIPLFLLCILTYVLFTKVLMIYNPSQNAEGF